MSPALLGRQAALAALAAIAALAAVELAQSDGESQARPTPGGAARQEAAVGVYAGRGDAGCGSRIDGSTVGVVHPVLPCGVQLVVTYGGEALRTRVVGRAGVGREHHFDLTAALAGRLGLGPEGGTVLWRFAE
jgi:hypothetical protein